MNEAEGGRRKAGGTGVAPLRMGVLVSHLRLEEKMILQAARDRGIDVSTVFDRDLVLDLARTTAVDAGLRYDVILDRCVAHSRAAYALRILERWGVPTLNRSAATTVCDDKALCSLALEAASVPTPRTLIAFSVDSAIEACKQVGYPAVLKPLTGSWGRLLAKVNGPEQARAILEQKVELGSYVHSIFYVQQYVEKPGRDIRVYVVGERVLAASYRSSEHWITNAARGAVSSTCPITPEIEALAWRACIAVGARLAGVDLIETLDGMKVVEVNTGGEFKGLLSTTDVDIAGEIVEEAVRISTQRRDVVQPALAPVGLSD